MAANCTQLNEDFIDVVTSYPERRSVLRSRSFSVVYISCFLLCLVVVIIFFSSIFTLQLVIYVAKDPWGFFATVLMILTPLLGLSAFCAFKLAKEVQRQEEEKKLRDKRNAAIAKKQKHVKSE